MAVRGITLNSMPLPVTDFSYQVQRNLISEKAISIAGEPKIYGGTYAVSGSFGGSYRPDDFASCILGILGKPNTNGTKIGKGVDDVASIYTTLKACDEYGNGLTFGSVCINSCELSMRAGEIGKATFNWIGTDVTATTTTVTSASYDNEVAVFYNAKVGDFKCTGFTLKIERPMAADDYCIGSEYTQSLYQSDSLSVTGSLELGARDAQNLLGIVALTGDDTGTYPANTAVDNINNTKYPSSVIIELRAPDGESTLQTITLSTLHFSDGSANATGRQRFQRTINFRCETTKTGGIELS